MKRVEFSNRNRSDNLLHVEIPGGIVNIRVNLHDREGREVVNIEIIPDDQRRGGDGQGRIWDVDSNEDGTVTRLIRRPEYPNDKQRYQR
jgi:hypothetical protein